MFDELTNELSDRLRLFMQANVALKDVDIRNTLSVFDVQEALELIRESLSDQLIPEIIELNNGKEVRIGGSDKYRKDPQYERFWTDVEEGIRELIDNHFKRKVVLDTITKMSVHPMTKRLGLFIVGPMIDEFRKTHPTNVMVGHNNLIDILQDTLLELNVRTHPDDVLVARKMMQAKAHKRSLTKERRLSIIRNAAEKYADINMLDNLEEPSDEIVGDID